MRIVETVSVRQTQKGDWLVYEHIETAPVKTRNQYGRFPTEEEAEKYADEMRAFFRDMKTTISNAVAQLPHPTIPSRDESHSDEMFWTIETDDHYGFAEEVMVKGLGAEDGRQWAYTEMIVDEGYGCPYDFGQRLRDMLEDESAIIFRYNPKRIYFAMTMHRAAFYDPSKRDREHIPETTLPLTATGDIDWFSAVDALKTPPDDLITQAEASAIAERSPSAIHNAIRDGRLIGYPNPDAKNPRHGGTLVSRAQVQMVWGR